MKFFQQNLSDKQSGYYRTAMVGACISVFIAGWCEQGQGSIIAGSRTQDCY